MNESFVEEDDGSGAGDDLVYTAPVFFESQYFHSRPIVGFVTARNTGEAAVAGAHVGQLPLSWFDRAQTGDLLSRLTQDVELVRFIIGPTILYGAQALVMIPGCVYVMADLSPKLTGFVEMFVFLGVLLLGYLYILKKGALDWD